MHARFRDHLSAILAIPTSFPVVFWVLGWFWKLIGFGSTVEWIIEKIESISWVGPMLSVIIDPSPHFVILLILVSSLLIWLDVKRPSLRRFKMPPWVHITISVAGIVLFVGLLAWGIFRTQPQSSLNTGAITAPTPKQPTAPILTQESLTLRQKALTQLSDFIDNRIVALSRSAMELVDNSNKDSPSMLLKMANNASELIHLAYNEQVGILTRYDGIDDVFSLADWNYLAITMEPAINEYISTIELLTNNSVSSNDGSLSRHKSFARFAQATEKLSEWINDARRNIGKKRAEYDKTQVYK